MNPKPQEWPVLAVCGYSGAGKTTLLEALLPRLRARGLCVAIVKHDVHGLSLDRAGKDSDRLFRSGGDVLLEGPGEGFFRFHDPQPLDDLLAQLHPRYDLVLVEGHKDTPLPRIWLHGEGGDDVPCDGGEVLAAFPRNVDRVEAVLALLEPWLLQRRQLMPLGGCVLIGGASRRMGRPKHLLEKEGRTWLEHLLAVLASRCNEVVIGGAGALPPSVAAMTRLPDVPSVEGPLAGLLAAMRWAPGACWVFSPCDMPDFHQAALDWLLAQRAPGTWAILPRLPGSPGVEPLGACYEPQALPLLETMARQGRFRLNALAAHPKVATPEVPPELAGAWRNVNWSKV
ncbi:MAG TPA: molybdopterin-guanine dinucleotide biosynthesis protein B [Gammaproteobacteria bacterium]|nr:molybdopterin-guanine dinucleotide biosynthesis protein B [Gammaproteobacteria bacterium]